MGGGTPLIVRVDDSEVLDKTWQEIWDAFPNVAFYIETPDLGTYKESFIAIGYKNDPTTYYVDADGGMTYSTDNPNGYPQAFPE